MKQSASLIFRIFLLVITLSINACTDQEINNKDGEIIVGVFKGLGADHECHSDAVESLKIDKDILPVTITASDILDGKLDELDVFLFPGGGGSRQMSSLGYLAEQKVKKFVVEDGKGIVGICAGAYILSDTPDYTCLHLNPYEAIDRIHDERGHGVVKFTLTEDGKKFFPELKDYEILYTQYYEGPVLIPNEKNKNKSQNLAVMESDVHLEGDAPANMTNGKAMLVAAEAGKGRTFSSVGHPENTPGMRWLIPRAARWVAKKEFIDYPAEVVRPDRYVKETLFTKELRTKQYTYFSDLLYGDSSQKIIAVKELVKMRSWGAKERITGLLRDADPDVRLTTAIALVDLEHTAAIKDMETAYKYETDNELKARLKTLYTTLAKMCNYKTSL